MWKRYLAALLFAPLFSTSGLAAQSAPPAALEEETRAPQGSVAALALVSAPSTVAADGSRVATLSAKGQKLINQGPGGPGRYRLSFGSDVDGPQMELGDFFYVDVPGTTFTFTIPADPGVVVDPNFLLMGDGGFAYPGGFVVPLDGEIEFGDDDPNYTPPLYGQQVPGYSFYPYFPYSDPFVVPNVNPYYNRDLVTGRQLGGYLGGPPRAPRYHVNDSWYNLSPADPAATTQGAPPPPAHIRDFNLNLEQGLRNASTTKVWARRDGAGFVLDPNGNPMAHTTVGALWLTRDNVIYQFDNAAATLKAMGESMGRDDRLNIATSLYGQAQAANDAYVAMNNAWEVVRTDREIRNQFLPGDVRGQLQLSPNVNMRADVRYAHDQAVVAYYEAAGSAARRAGLTSSNNQKAELFRGLLAKNPYPAFLQAQSNFFALMNDYPLVGIKRDTYMPFDEAYFFEELVALDYGPTIDTFGERQGLLTVFDEFRSVGIETFTGFANEARTHITIDNLMPYGGPRYIGIHTGLSTNGEKLGSTFVTGLMGDIAGSYGQYKRVEFADNMTWNIGIASGVALGSMFLPGGQYIALAYAAGDVSVETYDVIDVTLETGQMEKMAVVTGFETLSSIYGAGRSEESQAWNNLGMAILFGAVDAKVAAGYGRASETGLRQVVDQTFDAARKTTGRASQAATAAAFQLSEATQGLLRAEVGYWRSTTEAGRALDIGIDRLTDMVTRATKEGVPDEVIGGILTDARAYPRLHTTALDEIERGLLVASVNANKGTVILPDMHAGAVVLGEHPQARLWLDFAPAVSANSERMLNLVTVGEIKAKMLTGQALTEAELGFIRTEIMPHGTDVLNWYAFEASMVETIEGTRLAGGFEQIFDESQYLWMRQQAGGRFAGPQGTQIIRPDDWRPWVSGVDPNPPPPVWGGNQGPAFTMNFPPQWGVAVRDPTGNYLPLLSLDEYTGLVARQSGGEMIDLGNVARPGIANVMNDGRIAVVQGAGRWEKTRPGDYLDVFIRSDAALPDNAVVVQTGISPDLVRQANLLSSRGKEGANPIFVDAAVRNVPSFNRVRVPAGGVSAPTSKVQFDIEQALGRLEAQGQDMVGLQRVLDPMSPAERLEFLQRVETAGGLDNLSAMPGGQATLPLGRHDGLTIQGGTFPYEPGNFVPSIPTNFRLLASELEEQEFGALASQQLRFQINLTSAAGVPEERILFVLNTTDDPIRQAQDLALTRLAYNGFELQPTIRLSEPLTPLAEEARDLTGLYVRYRDGARNLPPDQLPTIQNADDFNWLREQVLADPYYFPMTSRRGFYNYDNDPFFTPMLNPGAAIELDEAFWNAVRQSGEALTPRPGTFGGPGTSDPRMMFPLAPIIDLTESPDALSFVMPGEEPRTPLAATITSTGNSTGSAAFEIQIVNSGKPVRLRGEGVVLEPMSDAEQQGMNHRQALGALALSRTQTRTILRGAGMSAAPEVALPQRVPEGETVTVSIGGYCLEKDLRPPTKGEYYKIADATTQQQFTPQRRVLDASRKLLLAEQFKPDTPSDPEGYFHSIRQWAMWTIEQGFDQAGFADAFVEHSKKNLEAAGQAWTGEIEEAVRGLVPARWQAIQRVLQSADSASRPRQ